METGVSGDGGRPDGGGAAEQVGTGVVVATDGRADDHDLVGDGQPVADVKVVSLDGDQDADALEAEALDATGTAATEAASDTVAATGATAAAAKNGRVHRERVGRDRRRRRGGAAVTAGPVAANGAAVGDDGAVSSEPAEPAEQAGDAPATTSALVPTGGTMRPRAVARAQKLHEDAERAIAGLDENTLAALAPIVRHLNVVTAQLTEAHRTVGRLTAERDALRDQLAHLHTVPVAAGDDAVRSHRDARIEARHEAKAAKHAHRNGNGGIDADDAEPAKKGFSLSARQRQFIALGLLGGIILVMVIMKLLGKSFNLTNFSRDSLGQIAFIGPLMQVFLVGWLMYRVIRVGGKGARWLFPSEDGKKKRHRAA